MLMDRARMQTLYSTGSGMHTKSGISAHAPSVSATDPPAIAILRFVQLSNGRGQACCLRAAHKGDKMACLDGSVMRERLRGRAQSGRQGQRAACEAFAWLGSRDEIQHLSEGANVEDEGEMDFREEERKEENKFKMLKKKKKYNNIEETVPEIDPSVRCIIWSSTLTLPPRSWPIPLIPTLHLRKSTIRSLVLT